MKLYITMPQCEQTDTFFTAAAVAELEKLGSVDRNPYTRELTINELTEAAHDADVILSGWGTACITGADVARMPELKMIAYTGGSINGVVTEEVFDTPVRVLSGNNIFAKSVAEGCLAYTLAALRRLEEYGSAVRRGEWRSENFYNKGLIGKKIGIIGFGTITKYYLELLRWFDCEILIYSSHLSDEEAARYGGRTAGLEEIFSQCDIVSLHSSLNEKTKGMITRELLELLKPTSLFVNTARGALVDEEALFELICEGRFNAALDVFTKEPFDADAPVRKAPNALLIPHMGGPTIDMREHIVKEFAKEIVRMQNGEELHHEVNKASLAHGTKHNL